MNRSKDQQDQLVDQEGALRRLGGDGQLFREFITIFLEDSPTLLEEIRSGVDAGNATSVERSSHALKGLMSNFGAKECVEVALKLELAGREGAVDDCSKELKKLELLHEQLKDELKSLA